MQAKERCSGETIDKTRQLQLFPQIKEILRRMFGKINVPVFHLDIFASKMTANTVSYFMSSLEQLGTSDID